MSSRFMKQLGKTDEPGLSLFAPAPTERGSASSGGMRSHEYEAEESPVWRSHVSAALFRDRGKFWTSGKTRGLRRWLLTLVIGVVTVRLDASHFQPNHHPRVPNQTHGAPHHSRAPL